MHRSLLILRPQPGADRTADDARAMGLDPVIRPLFVEDSIGWDVPDAGLYDAMILTSARAVRLAGPALAALAPLRAYAVGAATADAARDAGLTLAAIGSADASALVAAAAAAGDRRLLWPCGTERQTPDVPDGVQIDPLPVYATRAAPVPDDWDAVLAQDPVALLHSARAAALFAERAGPARAGISIIAISDAAAVAAGEGWCVRCHAAQPRDSAMLALAAKLCQNIGMGRAADKT